MHSTKTILIAKRCQIDVILQQFEKYVTISCSFRPETTKPFTERFKLGQAWKIFKQCTKTAIISKKKNNIYKKPSTVEQSLESSIIDLLGYSYFPPTEKKNVFKYNWMISKKRRVSERRPRKIWQLYESNKFLWRATNAPKINWFWLYCRLSHDFPQLNPT